MARFRSFAIDSFEELYSKTDELISIFESIQQEQNISSVILQTRELRSFSSILLRNVGKQFPKPSKHAPTHEKCNTEVIVCHDMKVCAKW